MSRYLHAGVRLLIAFGFAGALLAAQAPTPPPAPAQVNGEAKLPAVPEVTTLKVQNALLRANMALVQLQATTAWQACRKATAEAEKVIKDQVAGFEKAFPGYTLDAKTFLAVKKAPAK